MTREREREKERERERERKNKKTLRAQRLEKLRHRVRFSCVV